MAGIGNFLRKDDGVGPYIAGQLRNRTNWHVLVPEAGLDRYLSVIRRIDPDVLILIDSMDFGEQPGYWHTVPVSMVADTGFHSHHISLKKLSGFFDFPTFVIGIQPADIGIGESLSQAVHRAAGEVIAFFDQY